MPYILLVRRSGRQNYSFLPTSVKREPPERMVCESKCLKNSKTPARPMSVSKSIIPLPADRLPGIA